MAIQMRRGAYTNYDPTKLVPGEIAVVQSGDPIATDGKAVYIAITAGSAKRLILYDEAQGIIQNYVLEQTQDIIDDIHEGVEADVQRAESAAATFETDKTLTVANKAADAKKVGDEISDIKADLSHIGLSDDVKTSLLACFSHVAWVDAHGQDYYDALEAALYADSYPRITAVFDAGINVIYTDDALDTLKQYLTVKYFATKDSAGTVIESSNYTLSGTLIEGTSTVTVAYNEVRTSVSIPGVVDFYNIWTRKLSDGTLTKLHASVDVNQSNTSMYPSRACILDPYEVRRHICVERGKAPYYYKNQTNVASPYYPIPIPFGANHVKITMEPLGQYAYVHFVPYDAETNTYENSTADIRISWAQFDANGLEKTLDGTKQWYMVMNTKYDSAGSSYPVEPTEITVEFSEV